jgi:predicted nucleic acid-binding protein
MGRKTEQHRRRKGAEAKTPHEAYVDTSAFIAFLDSSDSFHQTFKRLFSSPPSLIASTLVIAEGHGWFLKRYDKNRAAEFLAFVEAFPALRLQGFDTNELAKARRMCARFGDQKLTLADAHGLVIMHDRRHAACWSTDRHLSLTGVSLVITLT